MTKTQNFRVTHTFKTSNGINRKNVEVVEATSMTAAKKEGARLMASFKSQFGLKSVKFVSCELAN